MSWLHLSSFKFTKFSNRYINFRSCVSILIMHVRVHVTTDVGARRNLQLFQITFWSIDLVHWRHVSITTTPCWGSRLVALRAHVLLAESICAHPLSQCAHPGQLGAVACGGLPSDCMLGDGARGVPRLTPNTTGAPFCDVICIWSIYGRVHPNASFCARSTYGTYNVDFYFGCCWINWTSDNFLNRFNHFQSIPTQNNAIQLTR